MSKPPRMKKQIEDTTIVQEYRTDALSVGLPGGTGYERVETGGGGGTAGGSPDAGRPASNVQVGRLGGLVDATEGLFWTFDAVVDGRAGVVTVRTSHDGNEGTARMRAIQLLELHPDRLEGVI